MYFDTCYIAEFYFNEPESRRVRDVVRSTGTIHSSIWALAEFHAVIHRHLREGVITQADALDLAARFSGHVEDGLWRLVPVTESLLHRVSARMVTAPRELFLRTADAVHLMTAHELGEREVWTKDRHMVAAAAYFGLAGRSV